MEIEIIPSVCEGPDAAFSGSIKITKPNFDEHWTYIEGAGFKGVEDDVDVMDNLGALRKLVNFSEKHYKAVNLKHKDGSEYKSFADLKADDDAWPILFEVAARMLKGSRPSKNSNAS